MSINEATKPGSDLTGAGLSEGRTRQDEPVIAWVTKYALTAGIWCVHGRVCHSTSSRMLNYEPFNQFAHGNEWHRTKVDALARAEEMRQAKRASLQKSLRKLEALHFTAPDSPEST
jgi:hypothetical protein